MSLTPIVACLSCLVAQQGPTELKLTERPDIPEFSNFAAYKTNNLYVFLHTKELAAATIAELDRASAAFERYFGVGLPAGAVVEIEANTALGFPDSAKNTLQWLFPFPGFQDKNLGVQDNTDYKAVAEDLRKQIRAQDPNITEEELERRLKYYLDALKQGPNAPPPFPLAHELGHVWFAETIWKGRAHPENLKTVYGTPAEDYLDEIAAILLETPQMLEERRRFLKGVMANPAQQGLLWPLAKLVTTEHPNMPMLRGEETPNSSLATPVFYAQCLLLAEFMMDRSKNERIFVSVNAASKAGKGFAEWLKENGAKHQLPTSIDEFEKEWKAWMQKRLEGV